MRAPLIANLRLPVKGVPPEIRLAALIVLGLELGHLQRTLGYLGGGSWQQFRAAALTGTRPRWEDFTKDQAGITETTAKNYFECAEAVRLRLRGRRGDKELLKEMDTPPSKLSAKRRAELVNGISALVKGETQSTLRAEVRAAGSGPARAKAMAGAVLTAADRASLAKIERLLADVQKELRRVSAGKRN